MEISFVQDIRFHDQKYIGLIDPKKYIKHCRRIWKEHLRQEWVHRFIETLQMVPRSWHTSEELRIGTIEW